MSLPTSPSMDGISLVNVWTLKEEPPNRRTYFEALSVSLNRNWAPIRGFYSGDHKFIYCPVPELYDLTADLREENNLCSQDQELCQKYQKEYGQLARMVGVRDVVAQEVDPEVAEKLRALGYITSTSTKRNTSSPKFTPENDAKNLAELDWMLDDSLALHNKGNIEKAAELLEQVLAKRGDFTMAYLHLAMFYDELGQTEKSISTLKRALANQIEDTETYARLGLYLQKLGQFDQAVESIKKGIALDPRQIEAFNFLGMAYTNSDKYAEAEKVFRDALQLDPTVAITYNNLAVLHLQNYQTAVKYDPQMGQAWNGLGVVFASMNQPEKAIENWQKAAEVDPSQLDALLNIGYTYLKMNQPTQAAEAFRKFLDKAPPAAYRKEIQKVQQIMQNLAKPS